MKSSLFGGPLARFLARRGAFLFFCLFVAVGCDRLTPELTIRRGDTFPRHDGDRPPRGGVATDSAGGPIVIPPDGLFVTAVAYPDGYDWRRDTARGNIRGQLLLLRMRDRAAAELFSGAVAASPAAGAMMAAFDTVLALEAGAGRPVSLDPDRHQFSGGHLYTQCITEAGTVYRRDGRTVFLSQEREYLRGILTINETAGSSGGDPISSPADGTLYTLSQRLDEDGGFVLRRNWKPVLTREGGRIHGSFGEPSFGQGGALFADGGQPCFFYEKEGRWLLVRDGKEESVTLPDGIAQLYDIRSFDGVIYLVCRWKQREPVLFVGSKKYDLSTTFQTTAQKSGFRLLRTAATLSPSPTLASLHRQNKPNTSVQRCYSTATPTKTAESVGQTMPVVRFSGLIRLDWNGKLYTGLWSEKQLLKMKEDHCDWLAIAPDGSGAAYVCRKDSRVTAASVGQTEYMIENGGTLMMPQCACLDGDRLYLALTGPYNPILWINGHSIPLPLNGFPTSVTLR